MSDDNTSPKSKNIKCTPPTNRKVRNPFDKALIARLHKPLCSPGMCKIYKKQSNSLFRWDIDQTCALVPADITPCSSQYEPSPDPALERIAEEATEKFFSQEMVMPSPLESSKKVKPLQTSYDSIVQISSVREETIVMRDAQTVLTLPPELPPELEKMLQQFCTFTQDQDISGDYEVTANGSLRRKLLFEEHSYLESYAESTDDEVHVERRPSSVLEHHTPVTFSPDLSNSPSKGMKRTFGTPHSKLPGKLRNKILQVADFGEPCFSPIQFPSTAELTHASSSISPLTKPSSDEEKNDFTSPDSDAMATCLDCIAPDPESERESKRPCFCRTPDRSVLRRSKSLKEGASPPRNRKSSFSEKRSLSMSSLHRSRSVQKLDFSMDMSLDGSQADLEPPHPEDEDQAWSMIDTASIHKLLQMEPLHRPQDAPSSTKIHIEVTKFTDTPVKGKYKPVTRVPESPMHMSLDASIESENPLSLENKKVDFAAVDLKYLTENSQFDYNATKAVDSSSFKRVDSGFNENTFYANASSYYESAIKPSELTVTNVSNKSGQALKEISNVNWMRVDSGFKDETSDNMPFYEGSKTSTMRYSEAKSEDKENDLDRFFLQTANKNEAMSMSDIFTDEVTFNCNFSSTPSKNKTRQLNS